MKIFEQFQTSKEFIEQTKFVKIYKCAINEKEYKIIFTKRFANKRTIIHFMDNTVYWEQIPRFWRLAGRQHGDKIPIYKFEQDKNIITVFIIKGKPNRIIGLDDGIFRCANNFDENYINVMTYKRFKNL